VTGGPRELGFDYFFGTSGCCTAQPPYGFIENEGFVIPPSVYVEPGEFTGRPGMTAPGWSHKDVDPTFARRAVAYIESRAASSDPFFLLLTPSAPHEPCVEQVVPEFARKRSAAGPRGDMVWLYDWVVGEVLDALDRTGAAGSTLVFVTSDNGALPGDLVRNPSPEEDLIRYADGLRGYRHYGHKSCGDFRGYKSHIWEGGHREPLLVRWPGRIEPASVCNQPVCLTDLLATCAEVTGAALPDEFAEDGFSFVPDLTGAGDPQGLRRPFVVHHSVYGVFSLRRGPWKAIFDTRGSGGWPPPRGEPPVPGTPGQLYHVFDDPAETRNLWEDRLDVVEELGNLLNAVKSLGGRAAARNR
jgi:arylsulfatase A-like enzyme